MQPDTYQNITGKDFQWTDRPPQAVPVPANAAAAEVTRYIQNHADQVDQWHQIVNTEDILKQQLLESLDDTSFKGQSQAYINMLTTHLHD